MRGARPELRVVESETAGALGHAPQAECADIASDEKSAKWRFGNNTAAESFSDQDAEVRSRQVGDLIKAANLPVFEPPSDIPEEMHAEWSRIIADLQERRLFNESMLGVVRSYVMAQWTAAQAEKSIAENGVMVSGAGGAMKPNPATGLLRSSRDTISRLAAELGLTPTSRSRKSLQGPAGQRDLFSNPWDL